MKEKRDERGKEEYLDESVRSSLQFFVDLLERREGTGWIRRIFRLTLCRWVECVVSLDDHLVPGGDLHRSGRSFENGFSRPLLPVESTRQRRTDPMFAVQQLIGVVDAVVVIEEIFALVLVLVLVLRRRIVIDLLVIVEIICHHCETFLLLLPAD